MSNLYPEEVFERLREPRRAGELSEPDRMGESGNPSCGDEVVMYLELREGTIVRARHVTRGCAVAKAGADLLCEMVEGKTPEDAKAITPEVLSEALGGISPSRRGCLEVSVKALRHALG